MATLNSQDPWVLPDPALAPIGDGARFLPIMGRLDRFLGRWQKLKMQAPEQIEQLRMVATIESVGSSTRIEGSQLSDEQVRDVLAGITIDSFSARDEQEVRGYRDLLELIREQHQTLQVTENSLKEFHRILLQHSEKDAWHRGNYKQTSNRVERGGEGPPIVIFRTAEPAEARWWMERLVAELDGAWSDPAWHHLVLIADFILWFLAIHPFQDGNGRLARAVTTLLLLKAGYEYAPYASLERVIEAQKIDYYVALRASQAAAPRDARNYGDWLGFFLSALEAQQQVLEGRVVRSAQRQSLPAAQGLIIDLITERGSLTTPEIASALRMPARTVRYHVARLAQARLLDAPARTAGRRYSLPLSTDPKASELAAVAPEVASRVTSHEAGLLTPLDFAPVFEQQAMASPNGRAYATVVVVGATGPTRAPLGDRELDAFETFARALAPAAKALRATPEVAWWQIPDPPRLDTFQMWLYPGPLIQVHWALDAADAPDDGLVELNPAGLRVYWGHVLRHVMAFTKQLDIAQCVVALNVQTLPAGRPAIVDLDFADLPRPTRSGVVESVPPWSASRVSIEADRVAGDAVLRSALDQLFRHYSYRHTDAALDALFDALADVWRYDSPPTRLVGRRGTEQQAGTVA
ncbi:MAG: Fic family protein [Candidatus Dormibacteria bacterium]